ncbi:nicotinate-nucleotide adenylyltransferase [Tissierella creatinini]|nr:nicotinate-nucleotide adenylyltransferase [Tissierella creatinini]TJX63602.1 nicotinate-nucleotide adenylyltransferase [Soehngenia saccharolytica]
MKIGLMGGTFNPIHLGHLLISEHIRMEAHLDKVLFIPSGHPPHKYESEVASALHRYNMALLATENNPYFEVSTIEIDREGNTYTIDTIEELKRKYPDDEFYFIIGGDTISELTKWKSPSILLQTLSFIVIGRSGIDKEWILKKIKGYEEKYNASMHYIDAPIIEISSTTIRHNLKNGKSVKYMVKTKVEEYIIIHNLYKGRIR